MSDWAGRDPADEAVGELRTEAPKVLVPIDEDAPISGHRPPPELEVPGASRPEHEWSAARTVVFPLLRPAGGDGVAVDQLSTISLAGSLANTAPVMREGPVGLAIVYGIAAQGFSVLVNAEHVLAWGISGDVLHEAAMTNLAEWSAQAEWVEERTDERWLLSSATGDGYDASRILLPEARERITRLAEGTEAGTRILIGLPDRDLLVAAPLHAGETEFAEIFGEFLAEQYAAAIMPIAEHALELRGPELVDFAA